MNNAKDALENITHKKIIFIDIYTEDDFAVISIKDNAGGIPEELIKHIFEPYFTTKHKSQGTGIGLYMTKQIIVKHMLGSIEVENQEFEYESEKYMGAQFIIKVPRKIVKS